MRPTLASRVLVAALVALLLLAAPAPSGASDVDLGAPTTVEELLASPEYIEDEHGDVARLYQAFLNRTPDVAGLVYWIDQYEDGAAMVDLAWSFSASQEFQAAYGVSLSNAAFLEIVYSNVLGRGYDQAGFDYWLGEMRAGLSRPETVLWVVAGDEFRTSYPFSGNFPDVTAALIQAGDVPQWTNHRSGRLPLTEAEVLAEPACTQLRVLHSNTFQSFHGRADGGEFLLQDVYAFSSEARARAALENHRRLPGDCASQTTTVNGTSLRIDYSPSNVTTTIGDESVVVHAQWTWPDGSKWSFDLYVVRNGNVVTVSDYTVRGATRPDVATGTALAQLTSDRMQALLPT